MRNIFLTLALLTLFSSGIQAQKTGTDYAFFFYTADYTNGWTDLPEVIEDVNKLKNELADNYRFQVEVFGDLSLAEMKQALAEISSRPFGPEDQVLFYFTGHGYFQEGSQNGYLIPADGRHDWAFGDGWLSYNKLGEYLSHNQAQHILVAFDACYSGSFGRQTKGAPGAPPWEKEADCETINRNSLRYKSRLFFSSGSKDERVPKQSEFLSRWLQCLRDLPGQGQYVISDNELRKYINTVYTSSPESGTFDGHEESGKFVLLHKNACVQKIPRPEITSDDNTVPAPLKVTDEEHWEDIFKNRQWGKADEHLRLFKECPHFTDVSLIVLRAEILNARLPRTVTPEPLTTNMINVNGGVFLMGDTFGDGEENELPIHKVKISPFEMGKYEVTFDEYDRFTSNVSREQVEAKNGAGLKPVNNISWLDAISYCNWLSVKLGYPPVYSIHEPSRHTAWVSSNYGLKLKKDDRVIIDWNANGYRLPTEAEWEFVASYAQGKEKMKYGNGENILTVENASFWTGEIKTSKNDKRLYLRRRTSNVGSFNHPNPLGFHDMVGNVSEFCSDYYDHYKSSDEEILLNPKGGNGRMGTTERIYRGGSYSSRAEKCRSTSRNSRNPDSRSNDVGFRLARSLKN